MVRNEDGTPTAWKPGSNLELLLQGNSGGLPGALRVSDAWDESRRSIEARCLAPDAAASHLQRIKSAQRGIMHCGLWFYGPCAMARCGVVLDPHPQVNCLRFPLSARLSDAERLQLFSCLVSRIEQSSTSVKMGSVPAGGDARARA